MITSLKEIKHPLIKLVTREQWGARPSKTPPQKLKIPVKMLQLFDTRTADCKTKDECMKIVKDLQNEYMFYRGFDDIPWNFLVGMDGNVYEGRGFHVQSIKTDLDHPKQLKWNGKSIDVAYIGDYRKKYAKTKMSTTLVDLICETDRLGVMVHEFKLNMFIKTPKDCAQRLVVSDEWFQ